MKPVAGADTEVTEGTADESFVDRWSRRKLQGAGGEAGDEEGVAEDAPALVAESVTDGAPHKPPDAPPPLLSDDDLPPVEDLGDDDDYSAFLNPGVSEGLRAKALQRLFRSAKFNVVDGLDDYAEDYTQFAPLGDILTADMKYHMKRLLTEKETETAASQDEEIDMQEPDADASESDAPELGMAATEAAEPGDAGPPPAAQVHDESTEVGEDRGLSANRGNPSST